MNAVRADLVDRGHNVPFAEAAFFDAVADMLASGFDAEPQPGKSRPREFRQDFILDRVYTGVGPDIEAVPPLDDAIADADHMPSIQHEHFIGDLDIADAIVPDQPVDLTDHVVRAPGP